MPPPQDAEDARKLIEAEGVEALLIPADLSEGEDTCQGIVKQARGSNGQLAAELLPPAAHLTTGAASRREAGMRSTRATPAWCEAAAPWT